MWRSGAGGGQLALVHLLHGRAPSAGRGVQAVGVQHLQQQVVERHHVLALHAVQMLHAFVTAGRGGGHKEDGFRASPVQARGTASEGEVRVTPKTPACAPFSLFKEPFQDSLCRWLPCPLLALHLERERRRDSCVGGSFLKCGNSSRMSLASDFPGVCHLIRRKISISFHALQGLTDGLLSTSESSSCLSPLAHALQSCWLLC